MTVLSVYNVFSPNKKSVCISKVIAKKLCNDNQITKTCCSGPVWCNLCTHVLSSYFFGNPLNVLSISVYFLCLPFFSDDFVLEY